MCYTQEKQSSGNPLMKSGVVVLEIEMENKSKIGLHCSLNELLFDARLDLPAGRATHQAARGGNSNGGEKRQRWYGGFSGIGAFVEGGREVSAVCAMQATGGLKLSIETGPGSLNCCVVLADGGEEHEYMEVDVAVAEDVEMDMDVEMGDETEASEDIEMGVEDFQDDIEMQG